MQQIQRNVISSSILKLPKFKINKINHATDVDMSIDDVVVKVHLEFVHSLWMVAWRGGLRSLAAEAIQICDVQAHVLTSKR